MHQNNFADQILQLTNLIRTDGFIRCMYQGKNGIPSIILYTDQNFQLMKNMCCDGERTTVLGVDKTFNLGPVFVTAAVFKHLALYRRGTTNHPLMLGPIFLHSTSDFEAFYSFFGHISACLDSSNKARLVVGADDEKAMIKAMKESMPQATLLACTRHLQWDHGLGTHWTNNNCESVNHVLKQAVNWKPQPLLKLVDLLKGLGQTQNSDVTRALFDLGDYVVAPGYEHYKITPGEYYAMSDTQRNALTNRFLNPRRGNGPRTVTSTDGKLTVVTSAAAGKKPCQVKWRRTEKS